MNVPHKVHFAKLTDDEFIAVSVSNPRFCLSGKTMDETEAKAKRALASFSKINHIPPARKDDVTIARPVFVERELLCA